MDTWTASLHFPAGLGWIWAVHIACSTSNIQMYSTVQQNITKTPHSDMKYHEISKTTAQLAAATCPNYRVIRNLQILTVSHLSHPVTSCHILTPAKCQAKEQSALQETCFPWNKCCERTSAVPPKGPIWPNDLFLCIVWTFYEKHVE